MAQAYTPYPVFLTSQGTGAVHARQAVATAINPNREQHVIIDSIADYSRALARFGMGRRAPSNDQPAPLPVVIHYSGSKRKAVQLRAFGLTGPAYSIDITKSSIFIPQADLTCALSYEPRDRELEKSLALNGKPTIDIITIPTSINAAVLAEARATWAPKFVQPGKKLVTVLIGGDYKRDGWKYPLTPEVAEKFVAEILSATAGQNCNLVMTTSARTSKETTDYLRQAFAPHCLDSFIRPPKGLQSIEANPFRGYLACADAIIVTPDSMKMISDACATEAPVYIPSSEYKLNGAEGDFNATLKAKGHILYLNGPLVFGKKTAVNSSEQIASAAITGMKQKWPQMTMKL